MAVSLSVCLISENGQIFMKFNVVYSTLKVMGVISFMFLSIHLNPTVRELEHLIYLRVFLEAACSTGFINNDRPKYMI